MALDPLSDETLLEAVEALKNANGVKAEAARNLGMKETTFKARIIRAAKRGLLQVDPPEAPPGFEITGRSASLKGGQVERETLRYGPEKGPEWEVPDGAVIKRGTVQVGPDGRVERHWPRYGPEEVTPERAAEIVLKAFEGFKPFAPAIIRLRNHDDNRLTLYPLADWHVGMFAYGREADGPDWDLKIARTVLVEAFAELVEQTPKSAHAVVLGLGDLMHADSHKNQTPNSGNIMDVDTRYSKCLPTVCDIVAECCEMVRQKHKSIEVALKAGNHDVSSTVGIRSALRMYYRNDDRVKVDESPSPYYWRHFGVNLICATHGDGCKPQELPLLMASTKPEEWGATKSRHAHTGHEHHERTKEYNGVKVHTHRAPVPSDAWHHAQGYRSGRSMRAFHYDAERGSRGMNEVEIL